MAITRTKYKLLGKCKHGSVVAVTMIYGGIDIDEEFTNTLAQCVADGGTIELTQESVTAGGCDCVAT